MQKVNEILNIFQGFRMEPLAIDQYENTGKTALAAQIGQYVAANEPINFVMLGFPFKSTNIRDKVLGTLPDLAEQATLSNFETFNNRIKDVYQPGVEITIVSDGYVFNDVLGVSDKIPEHYLEISKDMGKDAPMVWYSLHNFYSGRDIKTKREKVISQFGITEQQLEKEILFNPDVNMLYRGMMRFMEEEIADKGYNSRNQQHKVAKMLTRQMMFRNEAYSNLVRQEFPKHVRLSMHPSVNSGAKFSFKLIPGTNTKHSAWHSALVIDDNTKEFITMHKKDAVNAGYEMVYQNGQPFYFVKQ